MLTLSLDASNTLASVALLKDEHLLAQTCQENRGQHSRTLLSMIDNVVKSAGHISQDIDLISVGLGPGSFTGVRVALSTAKGLAMGLNRPLIGVESLGACAFESLKDPTQADRIVLFNAFKGEIYGAVYRPMQLGDVQTFKELSPPRFGSPTSTIRALMEATDGGKQVFIGVGARVYETFAKAAAKESYATLPATYDRVTGRAVGILGYRSFLAGCNPKVHALEPIYMRPPDATLPNRPSFPSKPPR